MSPPGYLCPKCDSIMNACKLCEEPCSGDFCGLLCEEQFYERLDKTGFWGDLEKELQEFETGVSTSSVKPTGRPS